MGGDVSWKGIDLTNKQKRICVGEISTVHGVRGLVKVRAYGEDPQTLQKYGPLFTSETGDETQTLTLKHQAGGIWVAEVKGINDRDVAAKLRGTKLWLERDKLPEIEGAYYHDDLIGMVVFDQSGVSLGVIDAVDNFGAGDLLDIKPDGKPSFYLPFVDMYVLEVKLDENSMIVDIPEGLIE